MTKVRWNDQYREEVLSTIKRVREKMRFIDAGQVLKSTEDANEAVIEAGCESKQIAVYYDENIVLVDKNLWDKLDYLNQATLILHEVVYKTARNLGETSSVSTRRYVSHLLSDVGLHLGLGNRDKKSFYVCSRNSDGYFSNPDVYVHEEMLEGEKVSVLTSSRAVPLIQRDKKLTLRQRVVINMPVSEFLVEKEGALYTNYVDRAELREDTLRDPEEIVLNWFLCATAEKFEKDVEDRSAESTPAQ